MVEFVKQRLVPSYRRLPLLDANLDFSHTPNRTFNLVSELVLTWLMKVSACAVAINSKWESGDLYTGRVLPGRAYLSNILSAQDIEDSYTSLYGPNLFNKPWGSRFYGLIGPQYMVFNPFFDPVSIFAETGQTPGASYDVRQLHVHAASILAEKVNSSYIARYGRLSKVWDIVLNTYQYRVVPLLASLIRMHGPYDIAYVPDSDSVLEILTKTIRWTNTRMSDVVFIPNEKSADHPDGWVVGNFRKYSVRAGFAEAVLEVRPELRFLNQADEGSDAYLFNKLTCERFKSILDTQTKVAGTRFKYASMRLHSSVWSAPWDAISEPADVLPYWVKLIGCEILGGRIKHRIAPAYNGMPKRLVVSVDPGDYQESTRLYDAGIRLNEFNKVDVQASIESGLVPFRRDRSDNATGHFSSAGNRASIEALAAAPGTLENQAQLYSRQTLILRT